MTPLRNRILRALALQPMTIQQLARCLSANAGYIQNLLAAMRVKHLVRHVDRIPNGKNKPEYLWGAA